MNMLHLKTNLRCAACVESIRPVLDGAAGVTHWSADVASPDKVLSVAGEGVSRDQIDRLLRQKGYQVLGEVAPAPVVAPAALATDEGPPTSYYPLVLIVLYILGATALVEVASGAFQPMRAMNHFMAGFFLVFSFFKLLDLSAFADAYASYDLVAARWRTYGFVYPLIELALGAAYLTGFQPLATNIVTLVVMGVSTAGVVRTLLARRKIRCACLGAVFNLPMSYVTLIEDLLMFGMAALMLVLLATAHG
jgi:cation transport ATPase